MKKIITACALGLFLAAGIIGCSGSPTTGGTTPTTHKKADAPPADKGDKGDKKGDMK